MLDEQRILFHDQLRVVLQLFVSSKLPAPLALQLYKISGYLHGFVVFEGVLGLESVLGDEPVLPEVDVEPQLLAHQLAGLEGLDLLL